MQTTRENLAIMLKKVAPRTFEKFRTEYLSKNYEFWDEPCGKNTLWFCERDFRTQVGYFLDWLAEEHLMVHKQGVVTVAGLRVFIFESFEKIEKL